MIIRFPGQDEAQRSNEAVSTTQIFDTVLETAGIEFINTSYALSVSTSERSLRKAIPTTKYVFSEAYTPETLITIIKKHAPNLMNQFHCNASRWAIYNQPYKLVRTENVRDEFFNYLTDPQESSNLETENWVGAPD